MLGAASPQGELLLTEQEALTFDAIAASDLSDIVGLIASTGYDPRTFFRHGVFDGMDFRGSDVRSVSFFGASLEGATLYRDQYDLIRETGPRSLANVAIVERGLLAAREPVESGAVADDGAEFDTPLERFLRLLDKCAAEFERTGKV